MELKEEIRARLNIEDVIGEYVHLKRSGRNYKGLSPFTAEKSPSFYVSPDKQIWHDFSGGKGGDVFSFVMEVEGIDFKAAMELLARKAGVDMSQYQTGRDQNLSKKKHRLLSALDLAATFYQQSLLKNPTALDYVVKKRRFNKEVVSSFRLGYSPNSDDGLIKALQKRGFSATELKDAGLAVNRRGGTGDMFRGRMMVPLSDGQGQVVGFTARLIEDIRNSPKYINTPQTILYDKGRQLYGLHLAKEAIRQQDKAVIVEGNLDVIASHQYGIKNVVAAAGTALTENHLKSLSRLSQNVALAFDADKAGIAATERAIGIAQSQGIKLTVVVLPDDTKDPDELVQKDPKAWQAAIDGSRPVVDWIIDRYRNIYDITSAEGKREISSRALSVINQLQDAVEQEHYMQLLAKITGASKEALEEKAETLSEKSDVNKRLRPVKTSGQHKISTEVRQLIYQDALLAITASDLSSRDAIRHLEPELMSGDERVALLKYLQANHRNVIDDKTPPELLEYETYVKIVLLQSETRYGDWTSEERYFEAAKLVRHIVNEKRNAQKRQLISDLRDAEAGGDQERAKELRTELNTIIKEQK